LRRPNSCSTPRWTPPNEASLAEETHQPQNQDDRQRDADKPQKTASKHKFLRRCPTRQCPYRARGSRRKRPPQKGGLPLRRSLNLRQWSLVRTSLSPFATNSSPFLPRAAVF